MTVKELKHIFEQFIENEFAHLRGRVDRLYYIAIGSLISIILTLIGITISILIKVGG